MITLINNKLENRHWLIETIFWSDGDYQLDLVSSWGGKRDGIRYQKSTDKYEIIKQELDNIKYKVWVTYKELQEVK